MKLRIWKLTPNLQRYGKCSEIHGPNIEHVLRSYEDCGWSVSSLGIVDGLHCYKMQHPKAAESVYRGVAVVAGEGAMN